jgi:AraC-like DNA-binding protein
MLAGPKESRDGAVDVLSKVVDLLRIRSHSYGRLTLGAPFAVSLPPDIGHFLIVTRGRCRILRDAKDSLGLSTGDFVFSLSSTSMGLVSAEGGERLTPEPFTESDARRYLDEGHIVRPGDLERGVEIVSGCFVFDPHEHSILTEHLDGLLTFSTIGPASDPSMTAIFRLISQEAQGARVGAFSIMDRLAEVLLIQALRIRMDDPSHTAPNWLAALRDPLIGKSIGIMHADLHKDLKVDDIAKAVGMSRSSFAARFRELVGRTPMEHLTRWRMLKAARMLADETNSVSRIASEVGYRSEGAFRRQFLEVFDASPSQYRKTYRAS